MSIKAQELVRPDDECFFETLLNRFVDYDRAETQKQFWQEIRRNMKSTKEKKRMPRADANEHLKDLWVPHLCDLEKGAPIDAKDLYEGCLERQNKQSPVAPPLKDLPSLVAVEVALKKTRPGKAAGPDQILPDLLKMTSKALAPKIWEIAMKNAIWAVEPVQWKGGNLIHIAKPGASITSMAGNRGVMLTPAIGKRLQSLGRSQLIKILGPFAPRGQIGGFKHKESVFGSHFVRSIARSLYQKNVSCATIFLDVGSAYHSLLRSLIVGLDEQTRHEYEEIREDLGKKGLNILTPENPEVACGALRRFDAPDHILQQTKEANCDTFAILQGQLIRTQKGSRPGSPLADISYMIGFNGAGVQLQEYIDSDENMSKLKRDFGLDFPVVVWADDVAILLADEDCDQLMSKISLCMAKAKEILAERGLVTNFKRGKTEVIITPTGPGAKALRQNLLREEVPNIKFGDDESRLRVEGKYRHLGSIQASAGSLNFEIKHRIGLTWGGFRELRQVFVRKKYNLGTRLRLAEALLWSKLFFGAGAWGPLKEKQIQQLEKCFFGILRAITGQKPYKDQKVRPWSNEKILAYFCIEDIPTRLAGHRLLYGKRMWAHGGESLLKAVNFEKKVCPGSWLEGLESDVKWAIETNGTEWGENVEQVLENWQCSSRNWKGFVRRAEKRQTLQRSLAFLVNSKNECFGDTIQIENDWVCECGAEFASRRALATHRHRKHGIFTREHQKVHGSICPCCLRQLWTNQRLKQHVRYGGKTGKNRCAAFIFASQGQGFDDIEAATALPMEGMKRRDAIQCEGPKNFGASEDDEVFVSQSLGVIEGVLGAMGLEDPLAWKKEEIYEKILEWMSLDEVRWEEWLFEHFSHLDARELVVNIVFAGARHQWATRARQTLWQRLVLDLRFGPEVFEWFDLCLRSAFLDRLDAFSKVGDDPMRKRHVQKNNVQFCFLKRPAPPSCKDKVCGFDLRNLYKVAARLSSLLKAWQYLIG